MISLVAILSPPVLCFIRGAESTGWDLDEICVREEAAS